MGDRLLPCILCGKEMERAVPDEDMPYGATTFHSYGHYGSTVFDPMNGSFLEVNICDDCLRKNSERVWLRSHHSLDWMRDSSTTDSWSPPNE